MSIKYMSYFEISDYIDARMFLYETRVAELRNEIESREVDSENYSQRVLNQLGELLVMLSEDNVVVTIVRLDSTMTDLAARLTPFKEFIDSQRFIIKILADLHNKPYL